MTGWYAKTLSQRGKEILLKSIHVYAMTCFKLPKNLCKNLTSVMMDFWWNNIQNSKKIHWGSWQKLTMPKTLGGIGFKDLQCFNQALLAKQAWRLLNEKDNLFYKIFKSRYFLNSEFLDATKGTRPSYAWRSILFGRELIKEGLKRVIGNGEQTRVWIDKWLLDGTNRRPMNKQALIDIEMKVSQLIDPFYRNWNLNLLRDLFPWKDIQLITKQRHVMSNEDSYCWSATNNGLYTVKSGYALISRKEHQSLFQEFEENPSVNPLYVKIWKLQTPPKIKIFLWKVLKGAVDVEDRLRTRGIKIADGCLMCGEEQETINHILFQCPLARQVWVVSLIPSAFNGFGNSIFTNMNHLLQVSQNQLIPQKMRTVCPWIIWLLWKKRNKLLFEGTGEMTMRIVDKAYDDCNQWILAQNRGDKAIDHNPSIRKMWIPPNSGELKCNIGVAWSKQQQVSGASWVIRDFKGSVLLHSRRSYSQVHSYFDAKLRSWEWALESMAQLRLDKVIFGDSSSDIIKALNKPKDWPAIIGHIAELLSFTKNKQEWFMMLEPKDCNKGAFEIVKSVITGARYQSYVATGYPQWLKLVFVHEKIK